MNHDSQHLWSYPQQCLRLSSHPLPSASASSFFSLFARGNPDRDDRGWCCGEAWLGFRKQRPELCQRISRKLQKRRSKKLEGCQSNLLAKTRFMSKSKWISNIWTVLFHPAIFQAYVFSSWLIFYFFSPLHNKSLQPLPFSAVDPHAASQGWGFPQWKHERSIHSWAVPLIGTISREKKQEEDGGEDIFMLRVAIPPVLKPWPIFWTYQY